MIHRRRVSTPGCRCTARRWAIAISSFISRGSSSIALATSRCCSTTSKASRLLGQSDSRRGPRTSLHDLVRLRDPLRLRSDTCASWLSADDRARSGAPHARHELGIRRRRPHALQHRQLLRRPAGNILNPLYAGRWTMPRSAAAAGVRRWPSSIGWRGRRPICCARVGIDCSRRSNRWRLRRSMDGPLPDRRSSHPC